MPTGDTDEEDEQEELTEQQIEDARQLLIRAGKSNLIPGGANEPRGDSRSRSPKRAQLSANPGMPTPEKGGGKLGTPPPTPPCINAIHGCPYRAHTNPMYGGYCCHACGAWTGQHGPACERNPCPRARLSPRGKGKTDRKGRSRSKGKKGCGDAGRGKGDEAGHMSSVEIIRNKLMEYRRPRSLDEDEIRAHLGAEERPEGRKVNYPAQIIRRGGKGKQADKSAQPEPEARARESTKCQHPQCWRSQSEMGGGYCCVRCREAHYNGMPPQHTCLLYTSPSPRDS